MYVNECRTWRYSLETETTDKSTPLLHGAGEGRSSRERRQEDNS